MKRILSLMVIFALLLAFSACSAPPEGVYTSDTESPPTATQDAQEEVVTVEHAYIDIGVNEDGYYGLMGPLEIRYYGGEVESVYIDDPTLLYFNVSSEWGDGVYIFRMPEGDAIIDDLTAVAEELKEAGHNDLGAKVDAIIDSFTNAGPIEGAST